MGGGVQRKLLLSRTFLSRGLIRLKLFFKPNLKQPPPLHPMAHTTFCLMTSFVIESILMFLSSFVEHFLVIHISIFLLGKPQKKVLLLMAGLLHILCIIRTYTYSVSLFDKEKIDLRGYNQKQNAQ